MSIAFVAIGIIMIITSNLFYFVLSRYETGSGAGNPISCQQLNSGKSTKSVISIAQNNSTSPCSGSVGKVLTTIVDTSITLVTLGFILIAVGIVYYLLGMKHSGE